MPEHWGGAGWGQLEDSEAGICANTLTSESSCLAKDRATGSAGDSVNKQMNEWSNVRGGWWELFSSPAFLGTKNHQRGFKPEQLVVCVSFQAVALVLWEQLLRETGTDLRDEVSACIPISNIAQCCLVGSSWHMKVSPGPIPALACRDAPREPVAQGYRFFLPMRKKNELMWTPNYKVSAKDPFRLC